MAAKEAGLRTVPCRVVRMDNEYRFRRQVIENIHHNTMSVLDTAEALVKMLNLSPGDTFTGGRGHEEGISRLAREIGKSRAWIYDTLNYYKNLQKLRNILLGKLQNHRLFGKLIVMRQRNTKNLGGN